MLSQITFTSPATLLTHVLAQVPRQVQNDVEFTRHSASAGGIDWLMVLIYLVVGGFCLFVAWKRTQAMNPARWTNAPRYWWIIGGLLLLMTLGRILTVGDAVADVGRNIAKKEGDYGDRSLLQEMLIIQAVIFGVLGTTAAVYFTRKHWRTRLGPVMAMIYLFTLLGIRAISLHEVDAFFRMDMCGIGVGGILETFGLLVIAGFGVNSLLRLHRHPKPRRLFRAR